MPNEFERIKSALGRLPGHTIGAGEILVPVGDDAAVCRLEGGLLVATVDTMVEGRHFQLDICSPADAGFRAVEGAISDVVAMGVEPRFVLLSVSLPLSARATLMDEVFEGMAESLTRTGCICLGGDTTSTEGPLTIGVTALGIAPETRRIVRRSGATKGDRVYLTGATGLSAAGLELLVHRISGHPECEQRYRRPTARVDLAARLSDEATSLIDVSDGISSELHHLREAGGAGFVIDQAALPVADSLQAAARALAKDPVEWVLHGGEDYELLFTSANWEIDWAIPIGEVRETSEVLLKTAAGQEVPLAPLGFDHFRA